jgi:hypothetical protein
MAGNNRGSALLGGGEKLRKLIAGFLRAFALH